MNLGIIPLALAGIVSDSLPNKVEFHQGVDYVIEAKVDDVTHTLTGRARMRYTNRARVAVDTLYFHLHLNAFRPNSAWATREAQTNQRRFQDLGPDDHAFDRVSAITVNGSPVKPVFPHAPDSTVMAVPLKTRIAPTQAANVVIDWTSRLSTVARRQGRRDRHYDWAHWYPRIAVFDTAGWHAHPLVPQGEFFGEFASYDVTLDVAADQVLGATGVPVSGDPGWERVNIHPTRAPILKRDAYRARAATRLGLVSLVPAADRKHVRWRAEQVHHFGWAMDPAFVYEGDEWRGIALHALFLPGDTLWPGRALNTTKATLAFNDSVFGRYVYPQLTATRRLDSGGTEFPMITMDAASPPIVHEVTHQWVHAILANNERDEGWLDEGFDMFLGNLFSEAAGGRPDYARIIAAVARIDSAGAPPLATPAPEIRDFRTYEVLTYFKPIVMLRMLRWHMGDTDFRRGLRLYYEKNKLQHVDANDFRRAMETIAGKDLGWFFEQWLRSNKTLDYAVTRAQTVQQANGEWQTRVEITRSGEAWMPVDLSVGGKTIRVDSRDRVYTALVTTIEKPTEARLDPEGILLEQNVENNRLMVQ